MESVERLSVDTNGEKPYFPVQRNMVSNVMRKMVTKLSPILLAAPLLGCASPLTAEPSDSADEPRASSTGADEAVPNRPYSRGRSFANLDEYLAYLERANGPIDLPWWREVRPGVFQKVVRMTGAEPETATRDELNRRFGFEG